MDRMRRHLAPSLLLAATLLGALAAPADARKPPVAKEADALMEKVATLEKREGSPPPVVVSRLRVSFHADTPML